VASPSCDISDACVVSVVKAALGFLDMFEAMIDWYMQSRLCANFAPLSRGKAKLSAQQVVSAFIFHQLQEGGTLADSTYQLHGVPVSDPSLAERREVLHPRLFEEIMLAALSPLGDLRRHKECFYNGLRLLGIDGTQWSVTNTPIILKQLDKAASRRLKAAFAKLRLVCVIELGTHAPVAAAAAPASDGEQTVARQVWRRTPDSSLVIADRLFGTARTLDEALTDTKGRNIHFLVRVKNNIKVKILERFADGSALVKVPLKVSGKVIKQLTLREIHAKGVGLDGKKFTLRLWTTLQDWKQSPANELAEHYATRWESELYYRELKLDVRGTPVLASHTVETALQEVSAVVLASAVIARMRVDAADRLKVPAARISFYKLMLATRKLWGTFEMAGSDLTATLKARFCENYMDNVRRTAILPERRERSCPRVLRQPVSKWPRKMSQRSYTGTVTINVTRV
jgi:hypothetical protein